MSRTYRRKGAEVALHANFFKPKESYTVVDHRLCISYQKRTDKEITMAKAQFYSDSYRNHMSTPGWWNKMCVTVPNRRKTRDLLSNLNKMNYLDELESVLFPESKKPHIYYW